MCLNVRAHCVGPEKNSIKGFLYPCVRNGPEKTRKKERDERERENRSFFLTPVEVREDTFRIAGIAPGACTRAFASRHSEGSKVRACTHVHTYVHTRKTHRVLPLRVCTRTCPRRIDVSGSRQSRARVGRIPVISMSPLFASRDD